MTHPNTLLTSDQPTPISVGDLKAALIGGVHLPLANAEFAIEQHLDANGVWLDSKTRILLAKLRNMLGEIADASRRLAA